MQYRLLRLSGGKVKRVGQVFKDNIYTCGFCRSRGRDSRNGSVCFICKGAGTVEVRGPVVVCAFCRGTGQGHSGSSITCTICRGKGMVAIREPVTACPQCRGWGRAQSGLSCIRCRGKGVIENRSK